MVLCLFLSSPLYKMRPFVISLSLSGQGPFPRQGEPRLLLKRLACLCPSCPHHLSLSLFCCAEEEKEKEGRLHRPPCEKHFRGLRHHVVSPQASAFAHYDLKETLVVGEGLCLCLYYRRLRRGEGKEGKEKGGGGGRENVSMSHSGERGGEKRQKESLEGDSGPHAPLLCVNTQLCLCLSL